MNAIAIARAATAHVTQPNPADRVRSAWAAWRSIGAGRFTAFVAAFRAI
jgi:hypothetical protein